MAQQPGSLYLCESYPAAWTEAAAPQHGSSLFFKPCQSNQSLHKLGSSNTKCVLIKILSMTRTVVVPAWTHRAKRATFPT